MSFGNSITLTGNLAEDPKVHLTQSGTPVVSLVIAHNERVMDRATGRWTDGRATFVRCSVWQSAGAENVADSLRKGMRVMVTGKLRQHTFTVDGQNRSTLELDAEEIGASLRFATATVTKTSRSGREARPDGPNADSGDARTNATGRTPVADPWAIPAPAGV